MLSDILFSGNLTLQGNSVLNLSSSSNIVVGGCVSDIPSGVVVNLNISRNLFGNASKGAFEAPLPIEIQGTKCPAANSAAVVFVHTDDPCVNISPGTIKLYDFIIIVHYLLIL